MQSIKSAVTTETVSGLSGVAMSVSSNSLLFSTYPTLATEIIIIDLPGFLLLEL